MKKTISFALVLFVMLTHGAFASSALFSDVPQNSWYAEYVSRLVDEGIVDASENFRPADSLNRAELVKMVINVIDGLKDYSEPPTATFDDVPKGAWFYDYVEQAATLDIVMGYSDAEGNLIGLFGPADTVTRAAATKILVEAFDLSSTSSTPSVFKDVREGDWFKDYVEIASQNGIVTGYSNGNFGPADPVTRAQMAKMLVLGAEAGGLWTTPAPAVPATPEEVSPPTEEPTTPESPAPQAVANPATVESDNAPAGATEFLVAKYDFKARLEGYRVETVTIVNDVTGDKLGGNEVESTLAVKNVILKFPDKDGKLVVESMPLGSDGTARFANLDFFAKRDDETFFEVYVDLNPFSEVGDSLSGEVFRVGLQNVSNTSNSFRAVGDISGSVISGAGNAGSLQIAGTQVAPFVVRKSAPHFSLTAGSTLLTNGDNTLISFKVSADSAGSVGLARMVFDVSVSDAVGANLSLTDFKLFRDSEYLRDVGIYDSTGAQDLTLSGNGSLTDGISFVIVTFDQEEIISKGDVETYSLKASVIGPEHDDSVSTRIAQGDEESPLTGLTKVGQSNTGKIYVNGDPTAGIFTGALDFFQSLGSSRDVIWSDKSAELHLFPTISGGVITSDSGSSDWTNGYLLELTLLEDQTLSR